MKRTDQLLYQMIPKAVADRLRQGEPAMNTCQVKQLSIMLFPELSSSIKHNDLVLISLVIFTGV